MLVNSGFFGSSDLRSGRVVRFPNFWSHSELSLEGVADGGRLLGLDFGRSYFPLAAPCSSVDVLEDELRLDSTSKPVFFIPEEPKLMLVEMLLRSVPAARFWSQD
ncbi:Uncharacterized protein Rs2_09931 [Raphanus sativus]|nr:Uncharacterized protein Rs2_09928 [Raphanus sativus]KAJ4906273.1 Uncharacterized protein Rs2_09931 [Raphanus sativus]